MKIWRSTSWRSVRAFALIAAMAMAPFAFVGSAPTALAQRIVEPVKPVETYHAPPLVTTIPTYRETPTLKRYQPSERRQHSERTQPYRLTR